MIELCVLLWRQRRAVRFARANLLRLLSPQRPGEAHRPQSRAGESGGGAQPGLVNPVRLERSHRAPQGSSVWDLVV